MPTALLACLALLAPGPRPPSAKLKAEIVAKVGSLLKQDAFVPGVDFSRWDATARAHRAEIDAAQDSAELATALNAALEGIGVSHLSVVPPEVRVGTAIENPGIVAEESGSEYVVTRVFDGSEAQRRGLHRGTVLKQMAWKDPRHLYVLYLDDAGLTWGAVLKMERTPLKSAPTLAPLAPDAFVLSVPEFSAGYDAKIVDGLMAKAAAAPYLVLDLRGNLGGQPPRLNHLLGYFLPAGTRVGAIVGRDDVVRGPSGAALTPEGRAAVVARAQGPDVIDVGAVPAPYRGHVAVLVDGETGSAGEIAARALQERGGAPVFGVPSAGQVVAAAAQGLPGGYQLVFPYGDYWSARGDRQEGRPVVPDFPAKAGTAEAGLAPAPLRERALAWLRERYPAKG